jgi:phosphate/sulfate permease
MEYYYVIIVVVLFALAISDLVVGVSNDAVNFLNSAIGSKAAPYKVIMAVSALGILIGATFSSGMMEVARQGIFHPDMFNFHEIMIIFLAVMMTDIILLDMFNTFGLPTSTTVSIVFELLGSAVAVSIVKISKAASSLSELANYINTDRALGIISGIFVSILIAFTVGVLVQWLIRLLFSFKLAKTMKYWGGLWGGFSFASIVYFLVVKGAKGASFMSERMVNYINTHTLDIILYSFFGGALIFTLMILFTRINILKIVVLIGTFALAMAFAGNDLVNFIGVPLAGFESFKAYLAAGLPADSLTMEVLKGAVKTPTMFLLIAGIIMALTLRYSRKARSVTATTINLSRQSDGNERFESSALARFLVRITVEMSRFFQRVIPDKILLKIEKRFDQSALESKERKQQEILAFDLLRASVNLVLAAGLIGLGTSLKLPLSTTYVTFMVAMGTSLSDGAWGRESAVYRISGVLTVVGGWFLTAFTAFTATFLLAVLLMYGGMVAIGLLIALAVFILIRSHVMHKEREKESGAEKLFREEDLTTDKIVQKSSDLVAKIMIRVSKMYYLTLLNFTKEKRKELGNIRKDIKDLNNETKGLKNSVHVTIRNMQEDEIESGHHYVQIVDYIRETTNCLNYIINPVFHHVDNNHPPLADGPAKDLLDYNEKMSEFFNYALAILTKNSFDQLDSLKKMRDRLLEMTNELRRNQIKALKKSNKSTKVGLVVLDLLSESKNMLLFVTNIVQAYRDFNEHARNHR